LVGPRSAEDIKISIGSALPLKEKKEAALRGRNLVTGLPEEIIINSEDIRKALEKSMNQIVEAIKLTIEQTPPELLADVMTDGIYLVGGGSLLRGLDKLIATTTRMPVKIIEDPLTAVVRGGGVVLENLDDLREILAETESEEPPK
ncbi:rod shape-determining protein, partial [Patescibacteria group bacterium]|nr:rod shape-determining protein [Patescibacteria group bacterium]